MNKIGPVLPKAQLASTISSLSDHILIVIAGKVYRLPASELITPAEVASLQSDDHVMVEIGGALKRIPASYILQANNYRGKAMTGTNPGTSSAGDWWQVGETGTFTNFGNQAATYLDVFRYDGTAWNLFPQVHEGEDVRNIIKTDPASITNPPAGTVFLGAYNDRMWIKTDDGQIRYIKNDVDEWYGIEWDVTVSNPDAKRIGNLNLHRSLPIQSKTYTCILKDDGTENYKLDPNNWDLQKDGVTPSKRDGTDGQVMTYLPGYYYKFEHEGNYRRLKFSEYPLSGFAYVKQTYVSAYEATMDRSFLKLASVKNMTAQFRGGNDDTSLDGTDATLLGKPATQISRSNFRAYARQRGTGYEMYFYSAHRTLYWFFMVEFATRNSQKAVNAALDTNGFRQGGLGNGVTTVSSTDWNNFNGYYPIVPIGASDSLASGTGEVSYALPATFGDGTVTVMVNRYRGVEMPFGHIWKNADGINVRIAANDDADPTTKVYISDDPALWNDANYDGFELQGEMLRVNGYVTEMLDFNIMPLRVGGGSSTFWCDYSYQSNIPAAGSAASLSTVLFGGDAHSGGAAGFGCSYSFNSPSSTTANFGSRLCFIPA